MSELANLVPLTEGQSEQAYVMAIQGNLELFIVNNKKKNKYKLSIGQVNKIRGNHPNKTEIYLENPEYNHATGRTTKYHYSQGINYQDIWLDSTKLISAPKTESELDAESSKYFAEFKSQINKAIQQYPDWYKAQIKVQATANLMEWLTGSMNFNKREAEIAKKVIKDIYSEI